MNVLALQWQDETEPWGWADVVVCEDSDEAQRTLLSAVMEMRAQQGGRDASGLRIVRLTVHRAAYLPSAAELREGVEPVVEVLWPLRVCEECRGWGHLEERDGELVPAGAELTGASQLCSACRGRGKVSAIGS